MRFFVLLSIFLSCLHASASVGLQDNTGKQLELTRYNFLDESSKNISLAAFFKPGKPVILVPIYFGCPGVCNITLNNLVTSLKRIQSTAGRGFEIVVFSFNPEDGPALAQAKKASYLKLYERPESSNGWHFLTGDISNSRALVEALGFNFEQDPVSKQYNHPAAVYVLSPEGKISVIFSGTDYPRKDLQRALLEASEGKFEILVGRVSALCYAYMPHFGFLSSPKRWGATIVIFLFLLGATIFYQRRRSSLSRI